MKKEEVHKLLIEKEDAVLEYPFGEQVAVYKVYGKMFALLAENKNPVNLSLKCDPGLSEVLRQNYESVMPGYHLNKKHWNTLVLSGQLSKDEIVDLINHSYSLVAKL